MIRIIHLCISVTFQILVMRDLEKMLGPIRMAIIYFGSGIGGYLASSVFVPYKPDVGPSGAHFGIIGCLMVEVWNSWDFLENPLTVLIKYIGIVLVGLILGLTPWIDNYAHFFGWLFGCLLSLCLVPYLDYSKYHQCFKRAQRWTSFIIASFLLVAGFVWFYIFPLYKCEICKHFTCLWFLPNSWCEDFEIEIKRPVKL